MNKILNEIKNILKAKKVDEADVKAKYILKEALNLSDSDLVLGNLPKNCEIALDIAKNHAQNGTPIQHLLGFGYFMGEKFKVTKDVLIPRDETELLVNLAIEKLDKINKNEAQILDIGTGSACISCMIAKKRPNVEILGVDISSPALLVAIENVQKFDLIKKVVLRKSDIFSAIREKETFDIIISNPPYIPQDSVLDDVVKNFEPHSALFAKNCGLEFYEKIIKDAKKYLNKGGYLIFECGVFSNGEPQAPKIAQMLDLAGFCEIEIKKDLAGIERNVCAKN